MADWRIYPNTRITRLPPVLQPLALGIRNIRNLFATEPFPTVAQMRVVEALELGVEYVIGSRVPGDIAEFGSHGFTASAIARHMAQLSAPYADTRSLRLFDSFQGYPQFTANADCEMPHAQDAVWQPGSGLSQLNKESLESELQRWLPKSRLYVYEGWFSETLPAITTDIKLAMVHFDCCLYSSAFEVLDYLFKNASISSGAIIMFHTWNCNQASPEYGERRAWKEATEKYQVDAEDAGPISWNGRAFHVHDYQRSSM
jgi:O-methyltransferase